MVSPINNLVEGTQAVAAGDYEKQLDDIGDDELGFLTRSFNTMTRKIARARAMAEESQHMEALQKNYLQSVLEHISSGVLTINEAGLIKRGNQSVEMIFGLESGSFADQSIRRVANRYPQLKHFFDVVRQHLSSQEEWREEIVIYGRNGRKILRVQGTQLDHRVDGLSEQVVVIDDLTELIQAQKNSAWSEMARRLAHEIKNPLTPIQLSAERLQRKLGGQVDAEHQQMLDRYTHTIVQQVDAMKSMVNTFTDYARASDQTPETVDFGQLLEEVLVLYRDNDRNIDIQSNNDGGIPVLRADPVRLRQVIHNLVKNAQEAVGKNGWIRIDSRCMEEFGCRYVELEIEDSGPGINPEILDTLFEPYVTTKSGGNGLGLAIVRKIIEEHGGRVFARNNPEGGAGMVVRLPVEVVEKMSHES
jgi:PAS domain S-box-containing protein